MATMCVAAMLALLTVVFVAQTYSIPSGSMEQTLHVGDRVLVSKLAYDFGHEPHPGDIVVFQTPGAWHDEISRGESVLIKRVIAVAGDQVRGDADGTIDVRQPGSNWLPLDEPYVYQNYPPGAGAFPALTIPAGRMWVMGDHRSDSADSLYHYRQNESVLDSTVPYGAVIGKAIARIWLLDRLHTLGTPSTFMINGLAAHHAVDPTLIRYGLFTFVALILGLLVGRSITRSLRRSLCRERPGPQEPRKKSVPGHGADLTDATTRYVGGGDAVATRATDHLGHRDV